VVAVLFTDAVVMVAALFTDAAAVVAVLFTDAVVMVAALFTDAAAVVAVLFTDAVVMVAALFADAVVVLCACVPINPQDSVTKRTPRTSLLSMSRKENRIVYKVMLLEKVFYS